MVSPTEPALHFHQVGFAYADTPVLANATFHVDQGGFSALVGPNGAGKSTVLKLMLGLLQPRTGRIIVLGRSPAQASQDIGYVPQHASFDPTFPIRVREVVRMGLVRGLAWRPGRQLDTRAAVARAMASARIEDLAHRPFGALSGGQRRRVLLARALVSDPAMLLLDEPTANLDTQSEDRLFQVLAGLKGHKTIILVSHDTAFVSALTDAVFCLGGRDSPGQIVRHRTSISPAPVDTGLVAELPPLRVLHDTLVADSPGCCDCHPSEEP